MEHGRRGTRLDSIWRSFNFVNNRVSRLETATASKLQAVLIQKFTHYLWWRIEYTTGLPATTIATADGVLRHGESVIIDDLDPTKEAFLYMLLTDINGAPIIGGAFDYALIMRDLG